MRGVALPLLIALAAPAAAAPVRMFAVGHKVRIDDAVTYQSFHDKMAALMDAAFPGRATLVQAGVDDVASHLFPVDPGAPANALVVFPEDVGLAAALIGSRGAGARGQSTSTAAILGLIGPYNAQYNYYSTKYPGQPFVRTLVLAVTDTLYRGFYETFRELAMTHAVYLAASFDGAPARRVEEPDPLVALLRDPDEPSRTYAYEAMSPFPYNTTLVFAPDGEVLVPDGNGGTLESPSATGGVIRGSTNKAYLTPIEEPPPGNDTGLSLAFGPVRDLEVLDTPVGRLAIVISKDAWMIDVNDRFLAKGANVVLQPEAFSEWAYADTPWQPDIFKEGGFANLQKNVPWVANVDASMTGNFFDVTFDGQSAVLGRKQKVSPGPLGPGNAWVGQNPDTGFRVVGPWIEPDPGIANPSLTLAERRALLAADGAKLLPGSGTACGGPLDAGACENGYREAIVFADVDVPEGATTAPVDATRAPPPRFSAAVRVNGPEPLPVAQHAPRVAARGARVYVVWHEASAGLDNVYLAVSRDRGETFAPPVRVSDHPPGTVAEMNPAIAARGRRVLVTWQEFAAGRNDDAGRIELARFDTRGTKLGPDVRVDDHDGVGKWVPAIALVGNDPLVAWVDERDTGFAGEPVEHIYVARGHGGGATFDPAVRIDAGATDPLAAHLDNKWGPALATLGNTAYAAWADFRNYNWDIFLARSDDGGATWGTNVRVDDFPDLERLDERPSLAVDRRGPLHVVWTDLRAREADTNIFYARSDDRGASFTADRQLDDSKVGFDADHDTPTNQWHPSLAADHGALFVAWQDDRFGNDDIFFTASFDGGASFAPAERVDDTGPGPSEQSRPSLALARRGKRRLCYAVWEDDRDGTSDVYLARRGCGGP